MAPLLHGAVLVASEYLPLLRCPFIIADVPICFLDTACPDGSRELDANFGTAPTRRPFSDIIPQGRALWSYRMETKKDLQRRYRERDKSITFLKKQRGFLITKNHNKRGFECTSTQSKKSTNFL